MKGTDLLNNIVIHICLPYIFLTYESRRHKAAVRDSYLSQQLHLYLASERQTRLVCHSLKRLGNVSPPQLLLLHLQDSSLRASVASRRFCCAALSGRNNILYSTRPKPVVLSYLLLKRALNRRNTTMSTSTAPSSNDDYNSRAQQSPLASQRAKKAGNAPSESNRTGRFGGYFTLGYKEGFSQWVRSPCHLFSPVIS